MWLVSGVSSICIIFQWYIKVLQHIRAIWYTDFGKLILVSKTKAEMAMDFSFTVIFGTMCTYFICTYCDSSDFRQTCLHILHRKTIHIDELPGFFPPSYILSSSIDSWKSSDACFRPVFHIFGAAFKKRSVFSPVIGYNSRQKKRQLWNNVMWIY